MLKKYKFGLEVLFIKGDMLGKTGQIRTVSMGLSKWTVTVPGCDGTAERKQASYTSASAQVQASGVKSSLVFTVPH